MRREVTPDGSIVLVGGVPVTGTPGPPGPPGPAGPRYDATFNFAVPSNVWTCTHNQTGQTVEVETYDSAGNKLEGDVSVVNTNTIQISWYFPMTGTARVHT